MKTNHHCAQRRWARILSLIFVVVVNSSYGQEGIQNLRALESASASTKLQLEEMDYTFKKGDFRLLLTPSLSFDYNDNISADDTGELDDFVLRPMLGVTMSYPLSQENLLSLNVGIGYDDYLDHNQYDTFRITSGTQLSFDLMVKGIRVNVHDRVNFQQDATQESSLANGGQYGNLNNVAGVLVRYELRDILLSGGYDHANSWSQASAYDSQDRASEILFAQATYQLNRTVGLGLEGTAAFTDYVQPVLNDNTSYSAGLRATWQPSLALRVTSRGGYSLYQFDNTSQFIVTEDLDSYYFDLSLSHAITKSISYGFSVGHETRLAVETDVTEETYLGPNVRFSIFKNVSLNLYASYRFGTQGRETVDGQSTQEDYDWLNVGLGIGWPFAKRFSLGCNYRYTTRLSNFESREYVQNLAGITLTYR
jgi:hypothetical protein